MTSSNRSDAAPTDPASISYADAAAELDRILAALDGDHVDVDVLAAHVERASVLITVCRDRISSARIHVERAVAGLASATTPTVVGDHALDEEDDGTDEDRLGEFGDDLADDGFGDGNLGDPSGDGIGSDARGDDAAP